MTGTFGIPVSCPDCGAARELAGIKADPQTMQTVATMVCKQCNKTFVEQADIEPEAPAQEDWHSSELLELACEVSGKYTAWVSGNVPVEFEKVTELNREWVLTIGHDGVRREIQVNQILWVEVVK
jgi:hypothetical protein